ncbi:MAG: aminotransferase class I/II-fold pyridoxal phosphate-dependent enzyme [Candidatus Adiutrix sp.]|jgi:8-amino-7-oxononanoate synthase|nr:aminotransferase class I/II-fold pyridoxal phosphate-dependent enzyme [Candidatus Adiutrix sp.]
MSDKDKKPFRLDAETKNRLLASLASPARPEETPRRRVSARRSGRIEEIPAFRHIMLQREVSVKLGLFDPFFPEHEGLPKGRTVIDGQEYLNFSTYDYLDLNGHPKVNAAAARAAELYGTSAGASRLVSGERPPHRQLERALANFCGVEDCLIYVSGYLTNLTVLSHLFGPEDFVAHDALVHNSLIAGAVASGASRFAYPHNDLGALERCLSENRPKHNRAIIVTEGLFSMDGSICPLPELLEIKKRHQCFLMVDEAHSLGTLGPSGRGVKEHFNLPGADIDIQMGTLSKTFCACGGFIAGSAALIDLLKFSSPGFVYSVGMAPPLAAAAAAALELTLAEPERIARLHRLSRLFLEEAGRRGLSTGRAQGWAVIPIMIGNSLAAGYLTGALHQRQINVQPIIYPVVEEGTARLRFFISAAHQEEQLIEVLDLVAEELPKAQKRVEEVMAGDEARDFIRDRATR